ncbi:MAG TPA: acetyl-CoA C-acetyltransferase [Bacteroidetes bacterium]|nr:acetyl-CoA C-acetyltransferase [Bacteroidota bacterium]
MNEVYIMSIARTPIGSLSGALASLTAPQLGAAAMKAAMERSGISPDKIQEVYMGNVLGANIGQAPAQQASIAAGIPTNVPCTTVNKVCASGMKAIMLGAESIMLGINDIVIAGGMESMSNVPYYLDKARNGYRLGHGSVTDGIIRDGLWDPYSDFHMGNAAEVCAKEYNITREDQDNYAIESYKRAQKAYAEKSFSDEIIPVEVMSGKEKILVSEDEEYKKVKFEKLPTLRSAFQKDGTITAANASKINDGASAVVLMSAAKAKELGLKPLAKITGFADAAQAPTWFTTTPALAIPKALKMAGKEISQVDFAEINEAFSVVSIINNRMLKLDDSKVNINGGAVSLGHPIGSSGARITVTLANILKHKNAKLGVAGICNGGGGASAIVLENMN